jgi:thiamine-phosphate pyrophosphorylase
VCPRNKPAFVSPTPADQKPILCYVTDRGGLGVGGSEDSTEVLLERIGALAAAGIDWIQIREKDLTGRAATLLVRRALRCAREKMGGDEVLARILVNDRLDVALAESAGGVHLGEHSLPVSGAARLARAVHADAEGTGDFFLGVSTHSLASAISAAACGASYIFFGPVFVTPSKAPYGEPQGLDRLAEVCRAVAIPVMAIGGITLENARSCVFAGAAGIAAIRLFQDAPDPAALVAGIREIAAGG